MNFEINTYITSTPVIKYELKHYVVVSGEKDGMLLRYEEGPFDSEEEARKAGEQWTTGG